MDNCIFCKIVEGKLPSYKVYEDMDFLGFLDIHPSVPGHTLVIPKKHYRWVYDVTRFGEYWQVALKITKAMQKSLKSDWVSYFTHGYVSHAHIHVLPRSGRPESTSTLPPQNLDLSPEEMTEIADKIRQSL